MKKLIQKIREKRGFTLAELLIVVAIIAVLVAIAIPIFTTQLEKSRQATDLANVRAAYAEAMTAALESDAGTGSATSVAMTQTSATSWDKLSADVRVGEVPKSSLPAVTKGQVVTVSVDSSGNVTMTAGAAP